MKIGGAWLFIPGFQVQKLHSVNRNIFNVLLKI